MIATSTLPPSPKTGHPLLLIGVVRSHNLAAGGQSLTVTPLTALDNLPGELRAQFWEALGVADPLALPLLPQPDVIGAAPRVVELRGRGHRLDFTGRSKELAELHRLLTSETAAPMVLHGLGGVGKSQLAVEYAHIYRDKFDIVWSVRGGNASVLASDLAALGVVLHIADADEPDTELQLARIRSWLASHPRWLLILDNVDDRETQHTVHQLLPDTRLGRVIVTSRFADWPGHYELLQVDQLDNASSAQLLLRATTEGEEEAARVLADELGGLPLALQQAAGYCRYNRKTLESYLTLFRNRRKQLRLLSIAGEEGTETVLTTWAVSVTQVNQSNPGAVVLLGILAYLAPDPIPRQLLTLNGTDEGDGRDDSDSTPDYQVNGVETLDSPDVPADEEKLAADPLAPLYELDEFGIDEALGLLHRYSLIQLTPEVITVHRLVQAVMWTTHQETQSAYAVAAANLVWDALPNLDRNAWVIYQALFPHALVVAEHAASTTDGWELALDLLIVAGFYQSNRAQYDAARDTHQRALAIAENASVAEEFRVVKILEILVALVTTLTTAANPSTARPYAERAVRIAEREFGPEHPQVLFPVNNLLSFLVVGTLHQPLPMPPRQR